MIVHFCIHFLGELRGFEEMLCNDQYSAKPNHTYYITIIITTKPNS